MLWLFFCRMVSHGQAAPLVWFSPVLYQVQKAFGKYGWKIKKNTTFWVVPVENLLEKRKIGKGSPVLPDGMLRMEILTACSFSSKQERIKLYTLRFKAIFDNGKGK